MSKYNLARHNAIMDSLRHGASRANAAQAVGIAYNTFRLWTEQFSSFNDAVIKAEAQWELATVKSIDTMARPHQIKRVKTLTVGGETVREETTETTEVDWQAAAWLLGKRKHEEYGDRDKIQTNTTNVNLNVNVDSALLKVYGNVPASLPSPMQSSDNVLEGELVNNGEEDR